MRPLVFFLKLLRGFSILYSDRGIEGAGASRRSQVGFDLIRLLKCSAGRWHRQFPAISQRWKPVGGLPEQIDFCP